MLSFIFSSAVKACIPWINILLGQAILCIKMSVRPLEGGRGVQSGFNTRGTGKTSCRSYLMPSHSRFISVFYFFLQKGQSHRGFFPPRKESCRVSLLYFFSVTVTSWSSVTSCDFLSNLFKILKRHFGFMRDNMFLICFYRRWWRKCNKKDKIFSDFCSLEQDMLWELRAILLC